MPTNVTTFVIVVLIGYAVVSQLNLYQTRTRGLSGNAVLLESALIGGLLFACFWLMIAIAKSLFASCNFEKLLVDNDCSVTAIDAFPQLDVLFVQGIVVALSIFLSNQRNPMVEIKAKAAYESGLTQ